MTERKRAPGGGRKAEYHEKQKGRTVTLPRSHFDIIKAYGNGVLSAGVRRLAEERWPELAEKTVK